MSGAIYQKAVDFLRSTPSEHINAYSLIHEVVEDNAWTEEEVYNDVEAAVANVANDMSGAEASTIREMMSQVCIYQFCCISISIDMAIC
jgi:hypothetical protein